MIAWKRDLQIKLTSEKLNRSVTFGDKPFVNLDISVSGSKHLSALKDEFTVRIKNITYREVIDIIAGRFYTVEIKAGYHSCGGGMTIFKGGVLYVSQEYTDNKTRTMILVCVSELIAKYGQSRLNFTLNSGINMYAALKYVCEKAGIRNSNISEEFKSKVTNYAIAASKGTPGLLQELSDVSDMVISSDSTNGVDLSIWNPGKLDRAKIKLSDKNIILSGGYPRISSKGLNLTILPTVNLRPGDVIVIDNSLIDLSVSSKADMLQNAAYFLDANGEYMVYDLDYNLENRGSSFTVAITARSRDLVKKAISEGGLSNV